MATENKPTTLPVYKKPLYLDIGFTSERWSDGIFNVEHNQVNPSLYIKEDELLSFAQREERETRSLLFLYQIHYAEAEYRLMQEEFRIIEEKLNREVLTKEVVPSKTPDVPEVFTKEVVPSKTPGVPEGDVPEGSTPKKAKKSAKSSSGSESSDTTSRITTRSQKPVFK